jgi:hypothetical protein
MSKDKKLPAVPGGKNVFEAYADDTDKQMIVGALLKFAKGDWTVGPDSEECSESELVAVVPLMVHGWIRWQDNHPVEHVMGLMATGFVRPSRESLGHLDETQWELNNKDEPRDPWREGLYLPMVTVDGETVFTFATSSDGGRRRGVAPLCREYGQRIRQHPDELPVVRLEQDSYLHSKRNIGRVKYPQFPVARWVKAEPYIAAMAALTGKPVPQLPGITD